LILLKGDVLQESRASSVSSQN